VKISDNYSLLAWRSNDHRGGCLATSLASSSSSNYIEPPTTVSSSGIHLEVPFIGTCLGRLGFAILNCVEKGNENKLIALCVQDLTLAMRKFEGVCSSDFELLDLRRFRSSQHHVRKLCIQKGRIRQVPQLLTTPKMIVSIPSCSSRQTKRT
jgi:hypothetical protein